MQDSSWHGCYLGLYAITYIVNLLQGKSF